MQKISLAAAALVLLSLLSACSMEEGRGPSNPRDNQAPPYTQEELDRARRHAQDRSRRNPGPEASRREMDLWKKEEGNTMGKAGRQFEKAMDRAEDAMDRAGDKVENAMERAGDKVEGAMDKAGDKVEHTMKKAGHAMKKAPQKAESAFQTMLDKIRMD